MSTIALVGQISSYVALTFGIFFFIFACKYYFAILIALFSGKTNDKNGSNEKNGNGNDKTGSFRNGIFSFLKRPLEDDFDSFFFTGISKDPENDPFVSIQLPFYNEKILKDLNKRRGGPTVKFVHRKDRVGFKGGALQKAVNFMDPRTKYVVVLDADFIPPPDILRKFLWYFEGPNGNGDNGNNGNGHRFSDQVLNYYENGINEERKDIFGKVDDWYERRRIGVVQGYQLHHLNKNENWITKGVRAEFSGGYMIERVAEEFFGSMKMITGSVFMIRAEILQKLGWTTSITEDWDLTLRMYMEGYKVLYTPLIQAQAEIPTTIRALARQRMRWAEGHTYAVKKYFWDIIRSPNITGREKAEFLYFAPYYLQSFFFLIGTTFWMIAELLGQHPYFWTATFGWCLLLSNLFALPLMSLSGLYLEETAREDYSGIFSFIVLSYVITPFQAYAAIKGLLERDEGGWVRTLKTGSITDRVLKVKLRRLFSWILLKGEPRSTERQREERRSRRSPSAMALIFLIIMSTVIVLVTAAAFSMPACVNPTTSLSLEYVEPAVDVNGFMTNRILTHPDYTSLGTIHTDSSSLHTSKWVTTWHFYLHIPLEQAYDMNGNINVCLYLYASSEEDVDVRIKIVDVTEDNKTEVKVNKIFKDVELPDSSQSTSMNFTIEAKKKTFDTNHSIMLEIDLRKKGDGLICYLDYDSSTKNSRVEFPGMMMPESLLPIILVAPAIPLVVLKLRKRREVSE